MNDIEYLPDWLIEGSAESILHRPVAFTLKCDTCRKELPPAAIPKHPYECIKAALLYDLKCCNECWEKVLGVIDEGCVELSRASFKQKINHAKRFLKDKEK